MTVLSLLLLVLVAALAIDSLAQAYIHPGRLLFGGAIVAAFVASLTGITGWA